jgi:PRC-barrel domain protein
MNQAWTNSRLRYIDAEKLEHSRVDFDGLDVLSSSGQKLGDVDGFVYDAETQRPYYVVVDSGGWFRSKQFLLPIGHAALDEERGALRTDIERDAIGKYPAFDPDRFARFTDTEVQAYQREMAEACCAPEGRAEIAADAWGYDHWAHYRQPDWWDARFQPASDLGGVANRPVVTGGRREDRDRERERIVARAGDDSPHLDGRAQPGDVLGIETGGERTAIGETTEDENTRRETTERAARKD